MELFSSQPTTIAEWQQNSRVGEERRAHYDALLAETCRLRGEAEASQRESFEVTEYLRTEIMSKDERIAELQDHLNEAQHRMDEQVEALKRQYAEREKAYRQESGAEAVQLRRDLAEAEAQLRAVELYVSERERVEAELAEAHQQCARLQTALDKEVAEAELAHVEQLGRVRKDTDARVAEALRRAEADIGERLDASTKRIQQQNASMEEELRVHMQETADLTRELEVLKRDATDAKLECQIKTEAEKQYARRSSQQMRKLREERERVAELERSLKQLAEDFERERAALTAAAQRQRDDFEAERTVFQRVLKLRTHELTNVRRLAQEVLLQRSDVEAFLLSSLQQVRREIETEQAKRAEAGLQTPPLEPLPAGKIDIKDLSWEDRERVLRLLFAKINDQAQQAYYAKLPPHSFDAPEVAAHLTGAATEGQPANLV